MTLAKLGFKFNQGDLDSLLDIVKEKITIDTYQVDTPEKIYEIFKTLHDDLLDVLQTNFQNLADDFENYWNQQAENLKTEIEQNLALNPDTVYDIQVKKAETADNALKFDNKTSSEYAAYIYTNYVSPATVNNSLHLEKKSLSEIMEDVKNTKVNEASNADKLNNLTYKDLVSQIASDITTQDLDLNAVKNKVENEWIAYKANLALYFGNKDWDSNYWINTLIPSIKVNEAVSADKFKTDTGTVDYSTLITTINTLIVDKVNAAVSSDNANLINLIKNTKINKAAYADKAGDSNKFANYDFNGLTSFIKTSVKVDKATNADYVGSLSEEDINDLVLNNDTTLRNDLIDGTLIPKIAHTVEVINNIPVNKFDDHINDLINQKITDFNGGNINADRFNGYTFNDFISYIQQKVKVDNSVHADNADNATHATNADQAQEATNSVLLDNKNLDQILSNDMVYYLSDIGFPTYYFYNSKYYVMPLFDVFFQTFFESKYKLFNEPFTSNIPENIIYEIPLEAGIWTKKIFDYDDNGNITKVIYLNKNDNGDNVYNTFTEKIAEEVFNYDKNGNIDTIEKYYYFIYTSDDPSTLKESDILNDSTILDKLTKVNVTIYIKIQYNYDDNGNLISEDVIDKNLTFDKG